MDNYTLIICGIIFLIVLLLVTVFALILYSGLIDDVDVDVGEPPLSEGFFGMYKTGTGSCKYSSLVFSEACSILPKLKTFGVFYDDPKKVQEDQLRWIAGSVIPKDLIASKEVIEAEKVFEENGFKKFEFPGVSKAVKSKFPFRSDLSIPFGAWRVYPQLKYFIEENKLQAYPFVEYYGDKEIHYFAPLDNHRQFYVPGIQVEEPSSKDD